MIKGVWGDLLWRLSFYKELITLHLTLPRFLRSLLHFRRRRNYTLSPTLLLTCMTKTTLNIHHHQPIEACYTQLSCFYRELITLHLTLPRLLRFLLHFRRRRNYTLSPTLLLGVSRAFPKLLFCFYESFRSIKLLNAVFMSFRRVAACCLNRMYHIGKC